MYQRLSKIVAWLMLATLSSWALADPPGRVGRISATQGQVTLRNDGDQPMAATLNWPVTSNNVFETAAGARAEIRVGSAAVRVAANSDLEIVQLDERHFTLQLNDGSASVHIRNHEQLDDFMLQTPNGRVLLSEPSQLRVDVDGERTVVSVFSGAARFEGAESNLPVRSGFRAEISGRAVRMSQLQPDAFDDWSQARDRRDDSPAAAHYVSPETTGYEELDQYGNWQMTDDDGAVWYPRGVAADWAPYRLGHWAWITPWGWTWVDNAPWGYAPSHYGRWARIGGRWGWLPGRLAPQPVWAPALVGWVGDNNWSASFSFGNAPAVGWFPLAPREAYVPSYPASQLYLQQINRNQHTIVRQQSSEPHYRNRFERDAVTVVPQQRFIGGRNIDVSREHRAIASSGQWQQAPVSPIVPEIVRRSHAPESAPVSNIAPPRTEFGRNRDAPWQDRRQDEHQDRPSRPALIMPPPRSTLQLQQQEQLQPLQQLQRQQLEQQQRQQEQLQSQQRQRQQQEFQRQEQQRQAVLPQSAPVAPVAPLLRSEPRADQAQHPARHDAERNSNAAPAQPPVMMPPPRSTLQQEQLQPMQQLQRQQLEQQQRQQEQLQRQQRQLQEQQRQAVSPPAAPVAPVMMPPRQQERLNPPAPQAIQRAPGQGQNAPQIPQREERRQQQRDNMSPEQRDELLRDPARHGGRKLQPWPQNEGGR